MFSLDRVIKFIYLLLAITVFLITLGGCSLMKCPTDKELFLAYTRWDGNYFGDRYSDVFDIVTLSAEFPVFGATAIVGPLKMGFMTSTHPTLTGVGGIGVALRTEEKLDGFGLRSGVIGTYEHDENIPIIAMDTLPACNYLYGGNMIITRDHSDYVNFFKAGAAAGIVVGFRAEFNFGELMDLIFGIAGIDLMKDDVGRGRKLRTLTDLDLNNTQLSRLSSKVGNLIELKKINLEDNALQSLPPEIGQLKNLINLKINQNQLDKLPPELGKLEQLEELELDQNQLHELPLEIGKLKNLVALKINQNQLENLPPELGGLEHIVCLELNKNQLRTLPSNIGQLRTLKTLKINCNHLHNLPPEFSRLGNLVSLDLSDNPLSKIPTAVLALKKLQILDVSNSDLHNLPPEIFRLQKLKHLNLSRNPLGNIPPEVFSLDSLSELWLSGTGVAELPMDIKHLEKLRSLDLSKNKIKAIPLEAFSKMPDLTYISLDENQLSCDEMQAAYNLFGRHIILGDAFKDCQKTAWEKKGGKTATHPMVLGNGRFTNSIGIDFVYIRPGSFIMGCPKNEWPEYSVEDMNPVFHPVRLTMGYYMQTTEVTQGQWKRVMGNNPSYYKECGDDCPVEQVDWDDAQMFILKLNSLEGHGKYRLPTEAEWEYACRAGSTSSIAFENGITPAQASYMGQTVQVGLFSPNAWGLFDMLGNVSEWCSDWYGPYPSTSVTDPRGPDDRFYRVYRGGESYDGSERFCRSGKRYHDNAYYTSQYLGFRLVKTP